jgi:hypothetical protein
VVATQRLDSFCVPVPTLKCAVNDRPLVNGAVVIFPSLRDMQHRVEHEKRLEALRWTPHDDDALRWDQLVDEVWALNAGAHFPERGQFESVLRWRFFLRP